MPRHPNQHRIPKTRNLGDKKPYIPRSVEQEAKEVTRQKLELIRADRELKQAEREVWDE